MKPLSIPRCKTERARRSESPTTCPYGDPLCPCPDGDSCHYKDTPTTKAFPIPAIILAAALSGCAAQLPPNSPKEHSSYVTCARSSPIMGWGGGMVLTVVLDETREGGTFKVGADCGAVEATMNQKAASVPTPKVTSTSTTTQQTTTTTPGTAAP